jgi:transposase InsO family protein
MIDESRDAPQLEAALLFEYEMMRIETYSQCGTFYYLCSILDGFSRFLVHWDLRESMREVDIEVRFRIAHDTGAIGLAERV